MLKVSIQDCPHCGQPIPREDYVEIDLPDRHVKLLHCDFCGRGKVASFYPDGSVFPVDYERRKNARNYEKFLRALESFRAA